MCQETNKSSKTFFLLSLKPLQNPLRPVQANPSNMPELEAVELAAVAAICISAAVKMAAVIPRECFHNL